MLAGKDGRHPLVYVIILIVVVALVLLASWSRLHTRETPVRVPLHDQK